MATEIWVNIGSGNGLLPDSTKPLPEPMLTDHQQSPVTFIFGQFHKRCLNHQSLKCVWKLRLKFHSNFPGANELTFGITMLYAIACHVELCVLRTPNHTFHILTLLSASCLCIWDSNSVITVSADVPALSMSSAGMQYRYTEVIQKTCFLPWNLFSCKLIVAWDPFY